MKKLTLLLALSLLVSLPAVCQNIPAQTDTTKYPLLIDGGKRIVYQLSRMGATGKREIYLDTITFSKGKLYERDSAQHPLRQFYLSYPEWKTIRCIVALDEHNYWGKQMIGLIEKSGKLRINYKNKKIYLSPVSNSKKDEDWVWTFRNKSMEITISARLDNRQILRHVSGNGSLVFRHAGDEVQESVYLVYELTER